MPIALDPDDGEGQQKAAVRPVQSRANEDYLAALTLARLEYDCREAHRDQALRPRRFALLLALQSELLSTSMVLASCCCIANAISAGAPGAQLRTLIRGLPQLSSRLTLAGTRLRRIDGEAGAVAQALSAMHDALAQAMNATVACAQERSEPAASHRTAELARRWRAVCSNAQRLSDRTAEALSGFGLVYAGSEASPPSAALEHAIAGGTSPLAVEPSDDAGADLRRSRRMDISGSAVLIARGHRCEIRVRNISGGGLGISDPLGLSAGETIVVIVDETIHMGGCVAWAGAGNAGIAFDRPLYDDAPELNFLANPGT
ncbi:MAG: PilZ domain-containing protein [Hyphomicrobiaceae bacterium]